jgi:hypothetical protein
MACALTEPGAYPDYLKGILKEINAGNNDDLKTCACSLKSPVTDEGCSIVDENEKVGAFPFCCTLVTDGVGDDTDYPLKLTLKQAMNLYWQTTSWNFVAQSNSASCGNSRNHNFTGSKRITVNISNEVGPPPPKKNLVCPNYFQYLTNYNGSFCTKDGCNPVGDSNVTAATMFESLTTQMKYKKEGDTYYFYPLFGIMLGNYAICGAQTQAAATDCVGSLFGVRDLGNISVPITILGESCAPLKIYKKIFSDISLCSYSGGVSISSLEFT